ncbi:MAG: beta-ketoacyl-ACP synthase II [Spirochaetales bacterium]|nr:beta-ketoacyl-ACP synthase II [Spirochaetales bacterium]
MKRIVVTGLGTVNPIGKDVKEFWENIKAGKSGVGLITKFDAEHHATKIAGEVKNFDPTLYDMEKKEARKMALFTQYAVASSVQAMKQAGLKKDDVEPGRIGVALGNGIGGFEIIESAYKVLFDRGPSRVPPMITPKMITNEGAANVAIKFNAQGPAYSMSTACASGTDAIGNAALYIRSGITDVMIAGGTEGSITALGVAGFNVIQALSTRNDDPEKASRPFDKDRDGFILAEGAGMIVLEDYEYAKKRGATILAELVGYGSTCDANHLTAPHPEGLGSAQAMTNALKEAGMKPEDIDYINAHGTSTPTNDPIETKAIKHAFGDHAYKLKVSSTKSMHGHLVGGTGGLEAIVSILAIRDNYFPATINLDEPEEGCDLDYVPNKGQNGTINVVLSNSLGFGGHNSCVIFKRWSE